MRKNGIKKNSIVLLVIFVISIIAAYIVKSTFFVKDNISNNMTLETLQNEKMIVSSYSVEDDFGKEELERFVEEELQMATEAKYAFEVIPTGNLYVNNSVIMQEVRVDRIIRGQCSDEKIWICSQGSTIEGHADNTYRFVGLDYSLMQEKNRYLVFCVPSEINEFSDIKIYNIDDTLWFAYYNITKDSDKIMESVYYDENIEFYTDSKQVLEYFNKLKLEVFKKLGVWYDRE